MSLSNFEKFIHAYVNANYAVKIFIDSEEIGVFVDTLIEEHRIPQDFKPQIIVLVSNLCLGIETKDQIGNNLIQMGISFEMSHTIYTKILAFLEKNKITLEEKSFIVPLPSNLQAEIISTEADIAKIENIRTMPHDMEVIRPGSEMVYRSSQADILPPTPVSAPIDETPRWETDTRR